MISATEALDRLRDGNRRFAENVEKGTTGPIRLRRAKLSDAQEPFAIVLGCADSRVPAELVFGQGPGDLFVIRVAGNVVAPPLIGSVEYAAAHLGTRLVVVLGHSSCGAVTAALEELYEKTETESPNLKAIVERIRPSAEPLFGTELRSDRDALLREAVRANVRASAAQLRSGSAILDDLIASDGLLVVGAEYSLETGEVEFFDGVPDAP